MENNYLELLRTLTAHDITLMVVSFTSATILLLMLVHRSMLVLKLQNAVNHVLSLSFEPERERAMKETGDFELTEGERHNIQSIRDYIDNQLELKTYQPLPIIHLLVNASLPIGIMVLYTYLFAIPFTTSFTVPVLISNTVIMIIFHAVYTKQVTKFRSMLSDRKSAMSQILAVA